MVPQILGYYRPLVGLSGAMLELHEEELGKYCCRTPGEQVTHSSRLVPCLRGQQDSSLLASAPERLMVNWGREVGVGLRAAGERKGTGQAVDRVVVTRDGRPGCCAGKV